MSGRSRLKGAGRLSVCGKREEPNDACVTFVVDALEVVINVGEVRQALQPQLQHGALALLG